MIKRALKHIAQPIRRFLGIEKITEHMEREMRARKHQIEKLNSYLEFSVIDYDRMHQSSKFTNFREIVSLLTPMDVVGAKYRRIGRDFDGGYVMLDDFVSKPINAAYSFGIGDDVSWEKAIAKLGIPVYMYDHTIKTLPKNDPQFHFFKEGVRGSKIEMGFETLTKLIHRNGHEASNNLLLKMDIEGDEWSVITGTPSAIIGQFSQIAIEYHGLDPNRTPGDMSLLTSALAKMNQTHQCVHVHGNGYGSISWLGEQALPSILEVSYVRREDYQDKLSRNTRTFPTEHDRPNIRWHHDIQLGEFCVEERDACSPDFPSSLSN